jgi:hypothetical protein
MEGKESKKGGFFSRVIKTLTGQPSALETGSGELESSFLPKEKEPCDLVFTRNFTRSGGKFIYCESVREANDNLRLVLDELPPGKIYCHEESVKTRLLEVGFDDFADKPAHAVAMASSCECLVAFNGGIMVSGTQTQHKKTNELPKTLIVLANTGQLVEKLHDGLTAIRAKYSGNLPASITTLHGPRKEHSQDEDQQNAKDIFLILEERAG